jgi:hypothetical protein
MTQSSSFRQCIGAENQSGHLGFSNSSGIPVIPTFRSFQLSGHSGYSPVILVTWNKRNLKRRSSPNILPGFVRRASRATRCCQVAALYAGSRCGLLSRVTVLYSGSRCVRLGDRAELYSESRCSQLLEKAQYVGGRGSLRREFAAGSAGRVSGPWKRQQVFWTEELASLDFVLNQLVYRKLQKTSNIDLYLTLKTWGCLKRSFRRTKAYSYIMYNKYCTA